MQLLREQVIAGVVVAILLAFGLLMADERELSRCLENPFFKTSDHRTLMTTVNHVDWSADGKTLLVESRNFDCDAHRLSVHQLGGQGYVPSWCEILKESLNHATLSPDGKSIVAATRSGELWWVDLETAAATELVTLTPKAPFKLTAISRDGRLMAGSPQDGAIYLCNPRHGLAKMLPQSINRTIYRLHFSNDGQRILCVWTDGSVGVWDTDSAELLCEIEDHEHVAIAAAAFLSDGSGVICMAGEGTLRIWDIASNTERWRGPAGAYGSNGLAAIDVTSNGAVAAWSEAMTRRIVIWDLEDQRVRYVIENPSMVMNLRFSPDGNSLAVAGLEHNVRIYDIRAGKETHRIDVKQIHDTNVRI
ncbi:MAG: (Myosin heavy-chain) kinase [Schlesneria sp.]|nr:(Myosin heavy-chain) kinase [Schlesneria sp.]